jgi:predicted small secreted protein
MKKLFIVLAVLLAVLLAGCAGSGSSGSSGGSRAAQAPAAIPEGAERLTLENGAYAIFKFTLPAGAKWSDYGKITAEFMVDERNIKKPIRNGNNVRLMGNYKEDQFEVSGKVRVYNLGDGPNSANGPYIMDNTPKTFSSMGAVPDQWFTVEYDISGTKGHAQFDKSHVPGPNETGPFFFGVGIPGAGEGASITELVRNVTLHHKTNPALNVISTGSGFEEPTFVSFYPVMSKRESK